MHTYDIPGFPGYKLTEDLQIIGKQGNVLTQTGKSHKYVSAYVNGKNTIIYVHRAVALIHTPGYFEGAWVDHIDDNPRNNDPRNLRWVTPKENSFHNKDSTASAKAVKKFKEQTRKRALETKIRKLEMELRNCRKQLSEMP